MLALPIFPRSGFDQSVTTPVLIGVLVSWAFTEAFGWVFAGLVVPGYLAAVFVLDPAGGILDVAEAAITYGVARAIGEHLPRFGVMSRAFGRERFFLVVLVSILVRLTVEGWILTRLAPRSPWAYSVGLVVIPLAANACWKTGLLRGLVQNGVPTLIVYLLLARVLIPYTNLSLAGFELATENVAASFLASPKAYILLVTGAAIAAAANVRYGWDFNGILVPGLIGLAVLEPVKLGATFVEALLLYGVVTLLVRVTPLRRANIEGPRRTVLFFTVDYAGRFAFAMIMGRSLPGADIVAFMGFGYLLPTLLAVKISQKGSAPLVLLPTAKVSVLGFAVGSMIGFAAHLVDRGDRAAQAAPTSRVMPPPPSSPAAAALWISQVAVEGVSEPDTSVTGDLSRVRELLEGRPPPANLEVATIDGGFVVARERFETLVARRGLPAYVSRVSLGATPIVALVSTPLASPAAAAAAGYLVSHGDIDAVVIAGIEESNHRWLAPETTAHAAARWLATGGRLVTVRTTGDERLANRKRAPANVEARLAGAVKRLPGAELASLDGETVLVVDPVAVGRALAQPPTPVALDSATSMAIALEGVRPSTQPGDVEHLVALRRLVLEPLLSPAASEGSRALAPFAAEALGYRISAPSAWPGGGQGIALLPIDRDRPLALFARTTGARARVVEAPLGAHRGVREVALRLAGALDADAVILGEVFDGAMRGGAVRAAHAAATTGGGVTVFLVREDVASEDAKLSAWMDDGHAFPSARRALEAMGVVAADAAPDTSLRDLATRTLLRPTPIVALTGGPKVLEAASLEDARRAHARMPDVPLRDGTLADAVASAAARLDATQPRAPDDIDDVVRRAASDASVVSVHRLELALAQTMVRAVIVRSREGTFLVAAARTRARTLVIAAPISLGAEWRAERRPTAEACAKAPIVIGVCEAQP